MSAALAPGPTYPPFVSLAGSLTERLFPAPDDCPRCGHSNVHHQVTQNYTYCYDCGMDCPRGVY